jgi:hypothetical protein
MEQGPVDERRGRAPVRLRLDFALVDVDLELGLEPDHRHPELVAIRESQGFFGHNLGLRGLEQGLRRWVGWQLTVDSWQ